MDLLNRVFTMFFIGFLYSFVKAFLRKRTSHTLGLFIFKGNPKTKP